MPSYILSKDAEEDLRDIARYTLKKWGHKQLTKYRQTLKKLKVTVPIKVCPN